MKTHTATSRGRSTPALVAVATFVTVLSAPLIATAATRWVNDDVRKLVPPGTSCTKAGYHTIQAAVNASGMGDTIRVCPGKYVENVTITTSNLTILSTAGAAATMVKAATSNIVFAVYAAGTTVRGFTIISAGTADPDIGVNVGISGDTGVKILENVLFLGRIAINLGCVSFGSVIANNTLTGQTDAGINIDTCEAPPFPGSHHNSIHHNVACSTTPTASIALGGASDDNKIQYNIATKISAFGTANVIKFNTTQTAIVDNGSGTVLNNNLTDPGVCPGTTALSREEQ
jgi:hypothetical protein